MGKPIPEALSIANPDNPDRYLEVRGRVIERTLEGAEAQLDSRSHKYMDPDYPDRRARVQAVTFCIEPEYFTFMD